jgi:hypothetical protein
MAACTGEDPDVASSSGGSSGATSSGAASSGTASSSGASGDGPPAPPASLAIFDDDMTLAKVRGTLVIGKAADETNVKEYVVSWGTDATTRTVEIERAAKVGNDVTIPLDEAVPAGATHLLVASANAKGELSALVALGNVDNVATHLSVSTSASADHAMKEMNGNLFITSRLTASSNYLSIKRCAVTGGACTDSSLSSDFEQRGFNPSMLVDPIHSHLFVLTDGHNAFRCGLDGTACALQSTLPSSTDATTSMAPSGAFDVRNQKALFAAFNGDTSNPTDFGRIYLFRCGLDVGGGGIAGCGKTFISPAMAGGPPSLVLDETPDPGIAYAAYAKADKATLARCTLSGAPPGVAACAELDVSSSETISNHPPQVLLDKKNQKVLVVAQSSELGKPALYRCNLDGMACSKHDISAGQGQNSGHLARATIDTVHDKLLVVTKNEPAGNKLSLFRCNLDGTACIHVDISAGQVLGAANAVSPVFSGTKLFVAAGPNNSLYTVTLGN